MARRKQLLTAADAIKTKRQHVSPCSDCPFARSALAGWLAGWSVWRWLNVAHGNGRMECHTRKQCNGEAWQCAGASIFRANVCKSVAEPLLRLPQNKNRVFAWDTDFASHHEGRAVAQGEIMDKKMRELLGGGGEE